MNPEIIMTDVLTPVQINGLKELIAICDNYEPYYNCGYTHFLYYIDASLIGFLSFIPDETNDYMPAYSINNNNGNSGSEPLLYCEVTALVHPEYRHNGIFNELITYAKNTFPSYTFYSTIPDYMSDVYPQNDIYFSEYLMKMSYDDYIDFKNIASSDNNISSCENYNNPCKNPYSNCLTSLEFYFSDDDSNYLAYISDCDEPVSVCNLDYEPSFTNIYGVFTEPEYRNMKIAYRMLESLMYEYFNDKELSNDHKNPLILNVRSTNIPAVHLYKKCGFKISQSVSYYLI